MRFIHHPVVAAIMTLIVAQQWFMVGLRANEGMTSLIALHLMLAIPATALVISYHQSRRKAAYYEGKTDGIGDALNPTCWRPRV